MYIFNSYIKTFANRISAYKYIYIECMSKCAQIVHIHIFIFYVERSLFKEYDKPPIYFPHM